MTYKAFFLSQKYRNPTILLVDGLLGQMAEAVEIKENPYPDVDTSMWRLDGAKNRPSREIHSLEPSQDKLNNHILSMYNKYAYIEQNEVDYEEYMCEDAEVIITAFGTMGRHVKELCSHYRQRGIKLGVFRPKTLYPFPYQRLRELSQKAKMFIDVEMNMGQMLKDVKLGILSYAPVSFIGKPVGTWLKQEEIKNGIDNILKEIYAGI